MRSVLVPLSARRGGPKRRAGFLHPFSFIPALAFALTFAADAWPQEFPARPLRLIVPQPPGGGTDILARNVAQKLSEHLRQPAIVDNRPGAGSLIGTELAAKATPDGHTLLVGGIFNMVMNKALIRNLSYEPLRDFVPLGYTSAYPFLLLARADLPVASLAELVKYAKERPGKLSYGSAGIGTLQHVWGTILVKSLGLDMLHVPFKGAAPAHQEMMGGRLDMMFDNLSASKQYVQAGRLKGLAVSSASRSPHLANVPTVNETGLVKFEGESWFGFFAPVRTPARVVETLRTVFAGIIRDPEFAARVERDGGRVLAIPADGQRKFLQEEIERWGKLVAQYGVTAE
jgi:tripartite-type tricarboxylate transporter receptor subunit TctC